MGGAEGQPGLPRCAWRARAHRWREVCGEGETPRQGLVLAPRRCRSSYCQQRAKLAPPSPMWHGLVPDDLLPSVIGELPVRSWPSARLVSHAMHAAVDALALTPEGMLKVLLLIGARALLSQRLPQTGVVQSLEVDRAKLTRDEAEPSARRVGKVLLLHLLVSSAASDCAGGRGWTEYRGNSSVRFYKGDCSTCSQHRVLAAHTRCQLRDGQYRRPRVHGARARAWSKRRRRREPRRRARGTVGDSQQLLRARNKRKSARLRQRQHHRSQPSARRTPTSTAR